jgi:chromosome segregation ATPase
MSVSGGSGVSAGGSNIDLETIAGGGAGFEARLRQFTSATRAAKDAQTELQQAKAEVDAMMKQATLIKGQAEEQLAENVTKAAELAEALKAADDLQANLTRRLEVINAICRE